jgi:signal transduction histidine kinase
MDKDVYTRLVTTNVPLAILPRREATCAHTINMPAGSVLSLPDMPNDPRFAQSPHVAQGGLVSYAGTPLRFSLVRDDGTREDVVFGTLCAASFKHAPALGAVQQRTMARFADIIVYDIVERARNVRVTDRHTMASRLASITSQVNTHNAVEVVLGTLRETYPHAAVALQHRPDDMIELDRLGAVPYTVFEDYLYENVAQIEADILAHNHLPAAMHTVGPTLRAIAIRHSAARHTYLVVQTARLTDIFDDVDTAFVHSCALILCNVAQAAELEQIMAARVSFLRSVSHDLRTPIHALLSSCELLVEDARAARATLSVGFAADGTASTEHAALLENALASGRALMSAVNNLLNFDALGTIVPTPWPFALSALEAALLSQTGLALAERGRPVQLVCENVLPPDVHMLNGDLDLYKQALGALLDNAVAFTAAGAITLRTALGADGALVFDVRDTGPGVAEARREHIFAVFDKGHAHGVGLGLPVAQRVTRALGGELALVETGPNGSWFRMQIEGPGLACQLGHPARRLVASDALRTFAFGAAAAGQRAEALRATLCAVGLEEADMQRANLVVIYAGALTLAATLAGVRERQVVVLLHEDEAEAAAAERAADAAGLRSRCVPMPALVGAEALWTGLGAALDVREAAIAAIMPREPSPISDVRSAAASTLPDSTLSNRVTRPARPALRILIVDDNVRAPP